MNDHQQARSIIVGVVPGQPDAVLLQAARFARRFDATLVCANVDLMCYVVHEHPDGSVDARQIDPDMADITAPSFDSGLADHIRRVLRGEQVEVTFRQLAGDSADALGRLAETLQAEMILVGTRKQGIGASVREYFGGSVAVHLAHRQNRCVVVVPIAPVPAGQRLPWEEVGVS